MMSLRRSVATLACALVAACTSTGEVAKDRLPRFVQPTGGHRVALVLGSGGPRGFAHIGVIKVLEESGIHPDLIIGSSVGAMVGALYASGLDAATLERMAHEINMLEFFEFSTLTGGPATGIAVQHYVNEHVGGKLIEQLPIAFAAAATRLPDRKLVLFNRGDAGLAVRASGASPGQFSPVKIGDLMYVDGDEASPVPIHAARMLGAKVVIAVDVSAYPEDTPPGVPQDWIDKDERRARQIRAEAHEADIMLHPNIGYYAGYSKSYREQVMAIAEKAARAKLPAIRAALARAGVPVAGEPAQDASRARMPPGEASR